MVMRKKRIWGGEKKYCTSGPLCDQSPSSTTTRPGLTEIDGTHITRTAEVRCISLGMPREMIGGGMKKN